MPISPELIRRLSSVRSWSIDGWLRIAGNEIGVTAGRGSATSQQVRKGGEDFQPALGAEFMPPKFGANLDRFGAGIHVELDGPKAPTKLFEGPNDNAGSRGVQQPSASRARRLMRRMG